MSLGILHTCPTKAARVMLATHNLHCATQTHSDAPHPFAGIFTSQVCMFRCCHNKVTKQECAFACLWRQQNRKANLGPGTGQLSNVRPNQQVQKIIPRWNHKFLPLHMSAWTGTFRMTRMEEYPAGWSCEHTGQHWQVSGNEKASRLHLLHLCFCNVVMMYTHNSLKLCRQTEAHLLCKLCTGAYIFSP